MEGSLAIYIAELRKQFIKYGAVLLDQYGLTDGTYQYLIYVCKKPGTTPGEMSEWFHMDHGHITRCILRLEKLGYVDRKKSETDRRQVLLYSTKKGLEIFNEIYTLIEDWDKLAMKGLTKEEAELLLDLLGKVDKTLQIYNGKRCFYNVIKQK
ncbi:MAG: bilirubin utilization transcriptional regulator BilQ [Acetivibrio ethanolgignens]